MEKQELEKRVVELVRETASMDTIFSVKISARDLRKIYTVQDLADLIEIRQ